MWRHVDLGTTKYARSRGLQVLINERVLTLGGNKKLKIYGTLQCRSGKRMKDEKNRVFFVNEAEAIEQGYRPCAHCMYPAYKEWKDGFV